MDVTVDVDGRLYRGEVYYDRGNGWLSVECPDGHIASGPHVHEYGEVEVSRLSGTPHRKCQVIGCRFISLDLDDDEDESYIRFGGDIDDIV